MPLDSYHVSRGPVLSERMSPAASVYNKDGGQRVRDFARQPAAAAKQPWKETGALVLRCGPYMMAGRSQVSAVSLNGCPDRKLPFLSRAEQ